MKILNLKNSLLTLSFATFGMLANAQNGHICGTPDMHQSILKENPELKSQIENLDEYLNSLDVTQLEKNSRGLYVIPLVFHVIHNYGTENISDAQIKNEVAQLNIDYQKKSPDTAFIVPTFKPLIANVGFEFRLATKDPNGNCTDGIDRIVSNRTSQGDETSKLNPWPRNRYFNIWIVQSFEKQGLLAYALKPAGAQFIPHRDGVICWHQAVGKIGTGNPAYAGTLSHEIGHSMNLDHPWGSTNEPGVACGDDNVGDTPITKGHSNCSNSTLYDSTSQAVCNINILENVQNVMDYSFCQHYMFTIGQADRMISALTSPVAQRSELITPATHAFAGVLDGQTSDCAPSADFNSTKRFFCLGGSTSFKDYSFKNTITGVEWTFPNSNTASSTTKNPTGIIYNVKGWQDVTLKAISGSKNSSTTKANYLYVADPADANPINVSTAFEDVNDYSRWPIFNYTNNYFSWGIYDGGNTPSGWRAIKYNGFDDRTLPAKNTATSLFDVDDIYTPAYNTTSLGANGFVSFKLAAATAAGNVDQVNESLVVSYSTNCGNTWVDVRTLSKGTLTNNGSISTSFVPNANTNWSTIAIPLTTAMSSNNIFFRIRVNGGSYSNNIYIDDFMVGNYPTSSSNVNTENTNFAIVPNPATNNADVLINAVSTGEVTITVTDMTGRVIYSDIANTTANQTTKYQLPTTLMSAKGIYMVTLSDSKSKSSQKLIIQ